MKKWWFVIFVPIYLLITFFGLGPVLRADGSTSEKITIRSIKDGPKI